MRNSKLGSCNDLFLHDGVMHVAINGKGVGVLEADSIKRITFGAQDAREYYAVPTVRHYFESSDHAIWIGAWNNFLHQYDPRNKIIRSYDILHSGEVDYSGEEIASITERPDHTLWVCLELGGIWEFNPVTGESSPLPVSTDESKRLNGNRIYCSLTDKLGRTWIGNDAGLHVYNPLNAMFRVTWLSCENCAVKDIASFGNALLIGTNKGLFVKREEDTANEINVLYDEMGVYSILSDSDSELYLGTKEALVKREKETGSFIKPYPNKRKFLFSNIGSSFVNSMTECSVLDRDALLVVTYGFGMVAAERNTDQWKLGILYAGGQPDNLVRKIIRDSKDNIWFVGALTGISKLEEITTWEDSTQQASWSVIEEGGLSWRYNSKRFVQYGIFGDFTSFFEDRSGRYWVGTNGSGLLRFDPNNQEEPFQRVSGSPFSVYSLTQDGAGALWMNAGGGVSRYDPGSGAWLSFDESDGVPAAGITSAIYTTSSGMVCIGGNGFLVSIDPTNLLSNTEEPRTTITHLKVFSELRDSLLYSDNIVLQPGQNYLSFSFSSLQFNGARNAEFQYMLEGIDDEWRDNGKSNVVTFSHLPFGKYTFRVRTVNVPGQMAGREAAVQFAILAPFYYRGWFVALALALFALTALGIAKYRKQQKLVMDSMRNKIARDLHDDIGSALGSISFYSESAKMGLGSKSTTSVSSVLDKIGDTSREMIGRMHDIVWAVNPQNDSMKQVSERMKTFAEDLCASHDLTLSFELDPRCLHYKLSMTERKNLFMIFKEAIYNGAKHSGGNRISVVLNRAGKNGLSMTISDNGTGFGNDGMNNFGNGLRNMRERSQELGGDLSIASAPGSGTVVTLMF